MKSHWETFLLPLAMVALFSTGCLVRVVNPEPPSRLRAARTVNIVFDYSGLIVNGMGSPKTEAEWIAAKSKDDPNYAKTWTDLKTQWESHFLAGLQGQSPVPVTRLAPDADTATAQDTAMLKVSMTEFQLGKYIPFATTSTRVRTLNIWSMGEQMVEENETNGEVSPGMLNPSVFQHIKSVGKQEGEQTARFFRDKQRT